MPGKSRSSRAKQQEIIKLGDELREATNSVVLMRNKLYQEFWEEQPQVWFSLLERKFDEFNVESNQQKSSFLLSRLTQKALLAVQDLTSDNDAVYEQFKERLINYFGDSVQHKVTKLFSNPLKLM